MFAPQPFASCPQCDVALIGPADALPCPDCGLDLVWIQAGFKKVSKRRSAMAARHAAVPIGPMRRLTPGTRREFMEEIRRLWSDG